MRHILRDLVTAVILLGICNPLAAHAPLSEYKVKAAYIFNFSKFVQWPEGSFTNSSTPLKIGILGETLVEIELTRLVKEKTLNNRRIEIKQSEKLEYLTTCHIIFFARPQGHQLLEFLGSVKNLSILTIGEFEEFAQSGGMIQLYLEDNKVRFEINSPAIEQAGLSASSRLLRLARNR